MEFASTHTDINALLESLDAYILSLVRKNLSLISGRYAYFANNRLVIDEIVQCVRINLWRASLQREIANPKAYIRPIVHNEIINILRKKGVVDLLSLDEVEECQAGCILISANEGMGDPAGEVAYQEEVRLSINRISRVVAKLAPRQRKVVICTLRDKYDQFALFAAACKKNGISADTAVWPTGRQDKRLLKANLYSARRSMRMILSTSMRCEMEPTLQATSAGLHSWD
jgi:DNA-directed RNA polymerase specialized sigma24 family protein